MSPRENIQERRRHRRIKLTANYQITLGGEVYRGQIGDISLGGVFLRTYQPTIPATALRATGSLQLDIDALRDQSLSCQVVYVRGIPHVDGVGCCFIDLEKEQEARLEELVRTLIAP